MVFSKRCSPMLLSFSVLTSFLFIQFGCKTADDGSSQLASNTDPCIGVTKPVPGTIESTKYFDLELNEDYQGVTSQEKECFEEQEYDESIFLASMIKDLQSELSTQHSGEKQGKTLRGFHAKAHGCMVARLYAKTTPNFNDPNFSGNGYGTVAGAQTNPALRDIVGKSKVGIWQKPANFTGKVPEGFTHYLPAYIRFSGAQGRHQSDIRPDGKGMAIKVLMDSMGMSQQDFTMSGSEQCNGATAAQCMMFGAALAGVRSEIDTPTENAEAEALGFLNAFQRRVKVTAQNVNVLPESLKFLAQQENRQILRNTLGTVRGTFVPNPDPSKTQYWSRTPYKLGDYAVKYTARPVECCKPGSGFEDLVSCRKKNIFQRFTSRFGKLREDVKRRANQLTSSNAWKKNLMLSAQDYICYDLSYQFQVSVDKTPVEDPTVEWSKHTPEVVYGKLVIPPQDFDQGPQNALCESGEWTTNNFLPEYRPLGHMNRARNRVYKASLDHRLEAGRKALTDYSKVVPAYTIDKPYYGD